VVNCYGGAADVIVGYLREREKKRRLRLAVIMSNMYYIMTGLKIQVIVNGGGENQRKLKKGRGGGSFKNKSSKMLLLLTTDTIRALGITGPGNSLILSSRYAGVTGTVGSKSVPVSDSANIPRASAETTQSTTLTTTPIVPAALPIKLLSHQVRGASTLDCCHHFY